MNSISEHPVFARRITASLFLLLAICQPVLGENVNPTSYSMPNGHGRASGGDFNYWDLYYTGSGNTSSDGAFLSGGLGDLTDGVIALDNWGVVESVAGDGPYVGWSNIDPTISFEFAAPVMLQTVRVHLDDSNFSGGVLPPESVTVTSGAFSQTFSVPDPLSGDPFWFDIDLQGMTTSSTTLDVTLNRRGEWVFCSEFEFVGQYVINPNSILVTRGDYVSGGITEISESDNTDLAIQRGVFDIQSRTEFVIGGVCPSQLPSGLTVQLEGSVFARSPVIQSIELFNYDSNLWEEIDSRDATRFLDSTVFATVTGDVTRFVDPTTAGMEIRIRYQSASQRQQFSSNTDKICWLIED
ncbi:MAG: hypothetical protein AAF456_18455 [Planctomycetota bacterium]